MDTISITIIFIAASTAITTILKAIKKDKCLKDFREYYITLIKTNGSKHEGKFRLESTGFELIYKKSTTNEQKQEESSYIVYKNEFEDIKVLARFHSHLTKKGKKSRNKALKKAYHPNFIRKLMRKLINFCKTIKDALTEIVNLLLSQVKKNRSKTLKKQDGQISKIKNNLIGTMETTSFDPLLEYHIGNIIIIEIENKDDNIISYKGVLKEYTKDFFEVMDVDYMIDDQILEADLIVPRSKSIIKHCGEKL